MLEDHKKANAKRQAAYRQRRIKEGTDLRLNVILDLQAKLALERMAKYYGLTNKGMLEQLLLKSQSELLARLEAKQRELHANLVA